MSKSGRFIVHDMRTGRKFLVEPIIDKGIHYRIGGTNGAFPSIAENSEKHKGAINRSESVITAENGFEEITNLKPGENPMDAIYRMLYGDGPKMLYP